MNSVILWRVSRVLIKCMILYKGRKYTVRKGDTHHRLKIIDVIRRPNNVHIAVCICVCGNKSTPFLRDVLSGHTKSCSCLQKYKAGRRLRTHGMNGHKLYGAWNRMRQRCNSPLDQDYKHYGGRGIKVCDRWGWFPNFVSDMEEGYRSGLTLDRIDVNGDYRPDNCRWVTQSVQVRNQRRNVYVVYKGKKMCLEDAAKLSPVHPKTIKARIQRGWTHKKAIEHPSLRKKDSNTK